MRVMVTGGRYFDNATRVFQALDAIHYHRGPITALIEGGATGADKLARGWALKNDVPVVTYRADWSRGRRAGPERNQLMVADARADLMLAFQGGLGTADAIRRAQRAELEVLEIE